MKKTAFIYLALLSKLVFCQSENQKIDTVFCSSDNTSYIIFSDKVDLVNIGNQEDYFAQIEDHSIFIKASREGVKPSTMLVKIGGNYFFGMLAFRANNKNFFYPFNKVTTSSGGKENETASENNGNPSKPQTKTSVEETPEPKNSNSPEISQKLDKMAALKTEITTLGFITSYINAAVTAIRNDEKKHFFKNSGRKQKQSSLQTGFYLLSVLSAFS